MKRSSKTPKVPTANWNKRKGCFFGWKAINGCEYTGFKIEDTSDRVQPLEKRHLADVEARSSLQISVVVRSCLKRPASLQSWSPWRMAGWLGSVAGWRVACWSHSTTDPTSTTSVTAWSNFTTLLYHFAWKHRSFQGDCAQWPDAVRAADSASLQAMEWRQGPTELGMSKQSLILIEPCWNMSYLLSYIVWIHWDTPFCQYFKTFIPSIHPCVRSPYVHTSRIPVFFNDPRR